MHWVSILHLNESAINGQVKASCLYVLCSYSFNTHNGDCLSILVLKRQTGNWLVSHTTDLIQYL